MIEIRHKTSADLILFLEFTNFIADQEDPNKSYSIYHLLKNLLFPHFDDGTVRNHFSKYRTGQDVCRLSQKQFHLFCERFNEVYDAMPKKKQTEYSELKVSFEQWQKALSVKDKTEKEPIINAIEELNLSFDKMVECPVDLENITRTLKVNQHIEHLLSVIGDTIPKYLDPKYLSPYELNCIQQLISSLTSRLTWENEEYRSTPQDLMASLSDSLFHNSWETFELDKDYITHKSIIFSEVNEKTTHGFRCSASYLNAVGEAVGANCYYNECQDMIIIIRESSNIFPSTEILSFRRSEYQYSLGHKVNFGLYNCALSSNIVLLKNTFIKNHNIPFYRTLKHNDETINDDERRYLLHPRKVFGNIALDDLPATVLMAIPFLGYNNYSNVF